MSEMPLSQQNVAAIGSASPLRLDLATVCGLAAGFGLLAVAIALGGSMASFVDLPSVLIVMGGTFAVVTICFSFAEVQTMLRVVAGTTLRVPADPGMAAIRTLQLAELARRNGPIHLEKLFEEHADTPFLQKAIAMVVDGAVAEELEEVLHHDLHAGLHRIKRSSAVLRRAADYRAGDGPDRHADRAGADAGPPRPAAADRPCHGGGAADHLLRRGPRPTWCSRRWQ